MNLIQFERRSHHSFLPTYTYVTQIGEDVYLLGGSPPPVIGDFANGLMLSEASILESCMFVATHSPKICLLELLHFICGGDCIFMMPAQRHFAT